MLNDRGFEIWSRLHGKHIFLTGGTGFFGRSLLEIILRQNKKSSLNLSVTILTRNRTKFIEKWPDLYDPSWINFHEGDIISFDYPKDQIDYVMHFATPADATWNLTNPLDMFDVIVSGTRRVLDFAVSSNSKKVILASSGAVYGKQPGDCSHLPETYPGSPNVQLPDASYGEAKRVAELLGNIYSSKFSLDFKIARCFAFVGPHLDPNGTFAIGNFIRDAISGDDIEIKGDGTPFRSYLYSDDLVLWLFKILLDGESGKAYNVGSDQDLSIKDLANTIVKVLGVDSKIKVGHAPNLKPFPERYVPSIELARKELGLDVFTSLEESIQVTAERYKKLYL